MRLLLATLLQSLALWTLSPSGNGIVLTPSEGNLPYEDHIEMSGEQMAFVLRWGVGADRSFHSERSLVFPMLRTVPNNTHASLMHRMGVDIPSLISVNGYSLTSETVERVSIDGYMDVSGTFVASRTRPGVTPTPSVRLNRKIFPSTDKPLMGEIYEIENITDKGITVYIPDFSQVFTTPAEKGVTGSYIIRGDIIGDGTFKLGVSRRTGSEKIRSSRTWRKNSPPVKPTSPRWTGTSSWTRLTT